MWINPTGTFVLGGPHTDCGLTGRKIIVDTYGGMGRHGGGVFSGKDPSKVDRSAAYAARWVAKHVVASGAATRCEVQVAYAIGVAHPMSILVETFGTATVEQDAIEKAVREVFDLRPAAILRDLDLKRPIYRDTATYGHFGRALPGFSWEHTTRPTTPRLPSAPEPAARRVAAPRWRGASMTIARVIPDVTGLDKEFDYLVPEGWDAPVGTRVRVPLHGRRVAGWVVAADPPDAVPADRLRALTAVSSRGPSAELVDLARWASVRWAAGRLRPFLVTASPPAHVAGLPAPRRSRVVLSPTDAAAARLLATGGGMLRRPPAADDVPVVLAAARLGPTLVVVPSVDGARAARAAVAPGRAHRALHPHEWAAAAGGVDIVVGTRAAAWSPCPGLAAIVVLDEHDEALQEERSPTWHARDVLVERGRRAGTPVLLASPCPTVNGLAAVSGRLARPVIDEERAGWPIVELVDRSREEPLEDVARLVAADHAVALGPHRGVRPQHTRAGRVLVYPRVPHAHPVRRVRRGRRARR